MDYEKELNRSVAETAMLADELAFWKYQAVWHRALLCYMAPGMRHAGPTDIAEEKARKDLEKARIEENTGRYDAEPARDIGS